MNRDEIRIAMIQMRVLPGQPEANLRHGAELVEKAAEQQCSIALLPECFDIGWSDDRAGQFARPVPGETTAFLGGLARRHSMHIVAGITEKDGETLYNTAVFLSDKGALLGKHRKINLVNQVETMYSVGDRLGVYHTPMGAIGISICADNLMPAICLGQSLAKMGAELILSPCSWAVPPERLGKAYGLEWMEPYAALCRESNLTIVSASNVGNVETGAWKGWKCIGNSIAMGPGGKLLAQLPYGEDAEAIHVLRYMSGRGTVGC